MSDEQRRMIDAKNAADDRYDFCQRILIALNSDDVDEARAIVKADMKIYEDEYLYADEKEEPSTTDQSDR